jgi:hypothetical protein
MSVQATAINDNGGALEFTEVRAETVEAVIVRAGNVTQRLAKLGKQAVGIAYDLDENNRRVRLVDGTEQDWVTFLSAYGIKDEGFTVKPSSVKHGGV